MAIITHGELTYVGDAASERSSVTPATVGSYFYALDTKALYTWDGSAWQIVGGAALSTATPQTSGSPGAAGSSGAASDGGHVHPFAAIAPLSYASLTGQISLANATSASAGAMSAADKTTLDKLNALLPIVKDPTGFTNPASVVITYDPAGRTITLTGTVAAYWQGTVIPALVSGWTSGSHADVNGVYYLSYDGAAFGWSTSPWTFDKLQVAYVNYSGSAGNTFAIRECHGLMPWTAHEEFHETIGCYRESGGTLGSWLAASTTAADRRPSVSACVIHDEDCVTTNGSAAAGNYTQMFLSGSTASNTSWATGAAEIVPVLAANPYYNSFNTPNWQQTLMANNSYMSVWLIAIPATASAQSQKYRFVWIQGQSNGNLASQTALTPASLNLGNFGALASEFVFLAQVILRYTGGNWDINSVVNITGNRFNQTSAPAGVFLSSVAVTYPLGGDGTSGSALTLAAATSACAGSLSALDKAKLDTSGSNAAGATSVMLLQTSSSGGLLLDRLGVGTAGSAADVGRIIAANQISQLLAFTQYTLPSPYTASATALTSTIFKDALVVAWIQTVYIATTNNASNYWTVSLRRLDTNTDLISFSTAAMSADIFFRKDVGAISIAITPSMVSLTVVVIKVGSPGPIYVHGPAVYVL